MPEPGTPVPRPRRSKPAAEPPPAGDEPISQAQTPELVRRLADVNRERQALTAELLAYPHVALEFEEAAMRERIRQLELVVDVQPVGLGYQVTAAEGVVMGLGRIRDSRGDLTAELAVRRYGNHLFRARVNLSSGQARVATARLLAQHPAGSGVDWREVLEQSAVAILDRQREGSPIEQIGDREPEAEPPSAIAPYVPLDGATLLWGPQGAGKSTLAAAIVVTLEQTAEIMAGWEPRIEARCLVLDWEATAGEWNDRIRRIAAGAGVEAPLVAYRRCRTPLADQVEELAEVIDRRGIGFLVVDSFEKAAGARSEGSTYEEKAERVFLALDRLARPSLLLDHVDANALRHGLAAVTPKSIGSTLKGAWARATYDLKRDPDRSSDDRVELLLHNVKINQRRPLRPYEFAMLYDGERGPIRFERSALTSPELMASLSQGDRLWRLLATAGRALGVKEIAEELGTTQGNVRALLSRDAKGTAQRFTRLPDGSIGLLDRGVDRG